ncbi:hypothetical protein A2867_04845 [Candidatus Daviesbacteria bacterium RIFCSPHIGHO2_01_FULL_40_11]|uniref:DUF5673 domain-containing protein n=1 Tax=Candidatus Daviesbacteria bacterium RIFCSPHIGHO2_01_FULL_40_11 TaxID=1797762 RepID=A0A1F5JI83_9BACT|nr:MAG: hypothetical protein A2867_04845 [Candidatus Daviesbacteria bacterium RIFCSPHIGHO2_01_FULL_40_11]OGE62940.1 MAG: hypothetical protein A2964_00340 [Candidatus Daviesbacteria bacterium RIFCSPLOWO2_01_FULL_40_27]
MPKDHPKQEAHKQKHPEGSARPEFFTPKMMEAEEIKTLMSWQAPARPFRKKDRSYYTTIAILAILLIMIAFLAQEFLLIGVILSFTFVAYVLAFVPPKEITYTISTQGITVGEDFYFWHFLDSFWFKEKDGSKVLYIQTMLRFPVQLMLVLREEDEEKVKKIVARFLPFHEKPYKSWMEKWSESLQKHFPLENIHH